MIVNAPLDLWLFHSVYDLVLAVQDSAEQNKIPPVHRKNLHCHGFQSDLTIRRLTVLMNGSYSERGLEVQMKGYQLHL